MGLCFSREATGETNFPLRATSARQCQHCTNRCMTHSAQRAIKDSLFNAANPASIRA